MSHARRAGNVRARFTDVSVLFSFKAAASATPPSSPMSFPARRGRHHTRRRGIHNQPTTNAPRRSQNQHAAHTASHVGARFTQRKRAHRHTHGVLRAHSAEYARQQRKEHSITHTHMPTATHDKKEASCTKREGQGTHAFVRDTQCQNSRTACTIKYTTHNERRICHTTHMPRIREPMSAPGSRAAPHTGRITRAQRRICKTATQVTRQHTHM